MSDLVSAFTENVQALYLFTKEMNMNIIIKITI